MKSVLLSCLGVLVVTSAVAAPAPVMPVQMDEDEDKRGELWVNIKNSDYIKVRIGDSDEDWSAVEFEKNGKKAIVKNIALDTDPVSLTFVPASDDLAELTVEIPIKKFKRKIIRDKVTRQRVAVYRHTISIKFDRKSGDAPKPEPKPEEDKPKPDKGDDDKGDDTDL